MGGGNVVQPGATLFPEDLQRNSADSPEALYRIIYSGKGKMPGYGADCAPRVRPTSATAANSHLMPLALVTPHVLCR
jgi:hypothetical protein